MSQPVSPYVTCPNCRAYFPLPDSSGSQRSRCPNCQSDLPSAAEVAGPKPLPPNRTILAEPEAMIRYSCPKCQKGLESPASFAGQKLNCPGCNQRLQIPQPAPAVVESPNKTILATSEGSAPPSKQSRTSKAPEVLVVEDVIEEPTAPERQNTSRENCLECGRDVSKQRKVQTCADCGSLFCSANCYREHRYHAHDKKKKKRRVDVECDFCGSTARPYIRSAITDGGWAVFFIFLIFFFPLCWIGLLMTETRVICYDCGRRID